MNLDCPSRGAHDLAGTSGSAGLIHPTVRTELRAPLCFPDGYTTVADVVTFRGLVDGREHLLLSLGDWRGSVIEVRLAARPPVRAASRLCSAEDQPMRHDRTSLPGGTDSRVATNGGG